MNAYALTFFKSQRGAYYPSVSPCLPALSELRAGQAEVTASSSVCVKWHWKASSVFLLLPDLGMRGTSCAHCAASGSLSRLTRRFLHPDFVCDGHLDSFPI